MTEDNGQTRTDRLSEVHRVRIGSTFVLPSFSHDGCNVFLEELDVRLQAGSVVVCRYAGR